MKYLILTLTLLAGMALVSCNRNWAKNAERTVIDVKIANFSTSPRENKFSLQMIDYSGKTYNAVVNKDGTFKFYVDLYVAQDVKIDPLIRTFIIHPGDSVHIDLDYNATGDIKFSGDAEATNNAIHEYLDGSYSNNDNSKETEFFTALDTASYRATCENTRADMLKNLDEFIAKQNPNDEAKTWIKNYINIQHYNKLYAFNEYYNAANKQKDPAFVPVDLKYAILKDMPAEVFNTTLLNSESYILIAHLANMKPEDSAVVKFSEDPLVPQLLAGYELFTHLNAGDIGYYDRYKTEYNASIRSLFIKKPLTDLYNLSVKRINDLQHVNGLVMDDLSGKPGDIITSIKDNNKGKVVYIDIWATWADASRYHIYYSKQATEKYKGKDVVFAFVCVASPKNYWKLSLANLNAAGHQYYCDSTQTQAIRNDLKIDILPYGMLISKNGDIVARGKQLMDKNNAMVTKIDSLLN